MTAQASLECVGDGGLGSSHTVPFGTAVPARPPTRSCKATRSLRPALCSPATPP